MKQITEDYCNFETAQLLKEKGFNEPCVATYNLITKDFEIEDAFQDWTTRWAAYVSAPTHQMTLKWLREVHNIHIEIRYVPDKFTDEPTYKAMIWDMSEKIGKPLPDDIGYMFYETCVNNAIKYTLENLI